MGTEPMREPMGVGRERTRTCAGCQRRAVAFRHDLIFRVVLGPASSSSGRGACARGVAVDVAGSAFGRGAHIHADPACLAKACRGGLSRAFRCEVVADATVLASDVARGVDRRVEGLLLGARRAGMVALGEDAREAVQKGAPLVIVASDAGASAARSVGHAVAEGRAVAWRTKAALGTLFARNEVALVAIRHEGVASEILWARSLADSVGVAAV